MYGTFRTTASKALEKILPVGDYKTIAHILTLSDKVGKDVAQRLAIRDSIMYVNAQFAIQNFGPENSNVILYAHSGHLNPISTYPAIQCKPLGSFLKQTYADNYSTLLLSIGEGDIRIGEWVLGMKNKKLASPVAGSLEYLLASKNEEIIYFPVTAEFDRLMLVRSLGGFDYPGEFFPNNIYQRYDGVLFIKECTEIVVVENPLMDISNELSKRNLDPERERFLLEKMGKNIERQMQETRNKIQNKRRLIEEAKLRIEENNYN